MNKDGAIRLVALSAALMLAVPASALACDMHDFYGAWGDPPLSPMSLSQAEIDARNAAAVAKAQLIFIARFSRQDEDPVSDMPRQSETTPLAEPALR